MHFDAKGERASSATSAAAKIGKESVQKSKKGIT
jgi:hypothetical protein